MIPIRQRKTRKAVVLLAVLVVVALLSLAAYKYSDYTLGEYRANEAAINSTQAKLYAESGIDYAAAMLASDGQGLNTPLGGNPWDNPGAFQGVAIGAADSQGRSGRFDIRSLRSPDDVAGGQAFVYGVEDEASKINLNALLALDKGKGDVATQILMSFSDLGVTENVAAAILDWMDPDDTPRTGGAENETYAPKGYHCKNGPLDSLEELLLVQGVTPEMLFGNDKNRNGILDPDEGTGTVSRGLSAYFTVYSREANADSTGKARINLNGKDLNLLNTQLTTRLGQELANFILAYKLYGPAQQATVTLSFGGSGGKSGASKGGKATAKVSLAPNDSEAVSKQVQADLQKMAQSSQGSSGQGSSGQQPARKMNRIASLWDLVNATVQVTPEGQKTPVSFTSPLSDSGKQAELLPMLLDCCTTSSRLDLRPRVNAATASSRVLSAFTQVQYTPSGSSTPQQLLTDDDVKMIVANRPTQDQMADPVYRTAAWLISACNLPIDKMKELDKYVTGKTQVYRIQSIGYSDRGGPTARVEAVIDTNMGRPRIAYYRDLSELGKGFDLGRSDR